MQFARNKRATFEYELLEKIEAGVVLSGDEVKAIRLGNVQFRGSFLHIHQGELYLNNCHISKYRFTQNSQYSPTHERKVLIKKSELIKLSHKLKEKGLTLIPLSFYAKGSLIKLEIALAKGKKKADKRVAIKNREQERRVQRVLKAYR